MSLNAQLTLKLDASSLVQGLIGELSGHAGSLNAIPNPASADQMSQAGSAGGSFLPASLVQSISQAAGIALPASSIPATIAQIESVLAPIEQLTTRDLGADLSQLATQLTTELESANQQGIPGILLNISNILQDSPLGASLGGLLSQLTSSVEGL